jgi:hypothetical protein
MDVSFFLNCRIDFIRQFYGTASAPYTERKRKIEAETEPFVPPYSEDDEPAFLEEWFEADESLQVLAYSCISMLAAALHLYFETWVKQTGAPVDEALKKSFKEIGWFAGYKIHFSQCFSIDFEASSVEFVILEEVVLARNRIEHPTSITSHRTQYTNADIKKLRYSFFVDEREAAIFAGAEEAEKAWLSPPTLDITEERLLAAIGVAEKFSKWFGAEIESRV